MDMGTTNISILTNTDGSDGSGEGNLSLFQRYFRLCKSVLLEPTDFFRNKYPKLDVEEALTFGLVTLWLSAFVSFIWDAMNQVFMAHFLESWMQEVLIQDESTSFFDYDGKSFLFSAGSLLLNPFLSLIGLGISAFFLFVLGKVFITDRRAEDVNMRSVLKVLAVASTGAWFGVVPFFGGILSYLVVSLLTVIGMRESFHISTRRSAVIVFLPQALLALFIMIALLFFAVLIFSIPWDSLNISA